MREAQVHFTAAEQMAFYDKKYFCAVKIQRLISLANEFSS